MIHLNVKIKGGNIEIKPLGETQRITHLMYENPGEPLPLCALWDR